MTATSSSDRYEAARKALATYEKRHGGGPGYRLGHIDSDHPEGNWSAKDSIEMLADALRALLEPPATVQTPEEIAEAFATDLYNRGTIEVLGGYPLVKAGDGGKRWNVVYGEAYRQGVLAGIQAAWESWEPENAPGLVEMLSSGDTER